ncbi:uncharacterized protein N7483_012353 [Penicillium malachiteum]|uniref:uncharacterized protein n=1 Tax=Penicillium malachiteum TaxID=1324776 RepID=UPI0025492C01|nr:uncharacterized protein N7483_012353 [Penicillium malachiteum]KAJ5715172.1 hypothetical protein N7483_012353 [Penicillium malachiteum]
MPQTTSRAEEGYTSGFFPAMDSAADEDDTDRTDGAELLARMADESPPAEYLDLGLSEIMRRGVTEYEREVVGPTVEMEQSMPHRPRPRVLSASWNPDDSAGPLIDPPPEPDVRMEDDPGEAPDEPEEQDPAEPPHWRDDYADPPPFAAHPSRFRFDFLWDTGSQIMTLYQDDLASMMSVDGLGYVTWPWPQVMGYVVLRNSDGQLTVRLCIMLTVNMRDNTALYEENAPELGFEDSLMLDAGWLPVPCAIIEGNIWHNTGYLPRLSGPWPRHMLNVYSEASNTGKMWLEANPIFDPQTLQGPSLHPPIRYTAEYGLFGPRRGPTTSSHIGWEPQTAPPAEGGWHTQLEAGVNFTRMAMMRRMGNLGIPYNRLVEPHPPLPLTDEDPEAEQGPASPAGGQAGPPGPAPGPAPVGLPVPIPGPPAADIAPEGDTEAEAFEGQGAQGGQALRGPRGEPGPSGPRGPRGRRGEMGDLGPPGLRGIEGPPGPQGPLGLDGPRGPQGYPGPEGVRGWPGHDGAQGPPGEEGARGPPGEDGAEGPPGEEGARGPPGEQGIPGPVNIPPPVGGPAARCLRCRLLNRQFCWHFYSRSRR